MDYTRNLQPLIDTRFRTALALLQASERTVIGHVDCGVAPHPGLGYEGSTPPPNLRLDRGRDFTSDDPDAPPITDLVIGPSVIDRLTDFPDHGIKTLSCILSNDDEFKGVAPGAQVVPVRIADGPIFQNVTQRDNMGRAIEHLLALDPVPRVISISMGNPGSLGLLQPPFGLLGIEPGFNLETRAAFDRAYTMGVIVVCAAGQFIDRVIYPARYGRTIAVGGYRQNRIRHYPETDYDVPDRVDIWAQADGINRAFARREADGSIARGYASTEGQDWEKVSGTSYATPQVAGAAALWTEFHFNALPRTGAPDAWKTVEAFRAALVAGADKVGLEIRVPRKQILTRPCLNIERLLAQAPVLPGDEAEMAPAARFWGHQS